MGLLSKTVAPDKGEFRGDQAGSFELRRRANPLLTLTCLVRVLARYSRSWRCAPSRLRGELERDAARHGHRHPRPRRRVLPPHGGRGEERREDGRRVGGDQGEGRRRRRQGGGEGHRAVPGGALRLREASRLRPGVPALLGPERRHAHGHLPQLGDVAPVPDDPGDILAGVLGTPGRGRGQAHRPRVDAVPGRHRQRQAHEGLLHEEPVLRPIGVGRAGCARM